MVNANLEIKVALLTLGFSCSLQQAKTNMRNGSMRANRLRTKVHFLLSVVSLIKNISFLNSRFVALSTRQKECALKRVLSILIHVTITTKRTLV